MGLRGAGLLIGKRTHQPVPHSIGHRPECGYLRGKAGKRPVESLPLDMAANCACDVGNRRIRCKIAMSPQGLHLAGHFLASSRNRSNTADAFEYSAGIGIARLRSQRTFRAWPGDWPVTRL